MIHVNPGQQTPQIDPASSFEESVPENGHDSPFPFRLLVRVFFFFNFGDQIHTVVSVRRGYRPSILFRGIKEGGAESRATASFDDGSLRLRPMAGGWLGDDAKSRATRKGGRALPPAVRRSVDSFMIIVVITVSSFTGARVIFSGRRR